MSDFETEIKKAIRLKNNLNKAKQAAAKEIADTIAERIKENYGNISSEVLTPETPSVEVKPIEKGYVVHSEGSQLLYIEFGTGTKGEESLHENKKKEFGLNKYNSGPTIVKNTSKKSEASKHDIPVNGLYWVYNDQYTQGAPAGKQIYNATEDTKKEIKRIVKRKVADVLSKQ